VLSSARPVAPVVKSIVPAFTWQELRENSVITRTRRGSRVRIELARPWFTTGVGESLAVIVPDGDPAPDLLRYVTQMGRDPIWQTADPPRFPALVGDRVKLGENGATVQAVGHEVWRHGDSWFADIGVPDTASYCPLVRFAVARYQSDSLMDLELSPVVLTDFVTLLPDRTLTVDTTSLAQGRVSVALSGLTQDGPAINAVKIVVEERFGPRGVSDLITRGVDEPEVPCWQVLSEMQGQVGDQFDFEQLPTDSSLRVRVREIEPIAQGATTGEVELAERVVFTDIVPLS